MAKQVNRYRYNSPILHFILRWSCECLSVCVLVITRCSIPFIHAGLICFEANKYLSMRSFFPHLFPLISIPLQWKNMTFCSPSQMTRHKKEKHRLFGWSRWALMCCWFVFWNFLSFSERCQDLACARQVNDNKKKYTSKLENSIWNRFFHFLLEKSVGYFK